MKYLYLIITAILFMLPFSNKSKACTNFIVGKKASSDGSVFITYNADDYGMFGYLHFLPAGKHTPGSKRKIFDGDTNKYHGEIDEAPQTYKVIGNVNEHQVSICETTFGGRLELVDTTGVLDYVSLMAVTLQRSKTAKEAIHTMTSLVQQYGYNSEGETFSIADKNEAWILEMIGKGPNNKGAVWVAIRVPDDCICAHANQSRIHKFNLKDRNNVMYSKDVITYARKKGYFTGKDVDFDFANSYCPAGFSELRFCEARVWSFYNKWSNGMDKYIDYVSGKDKTKHEPLPLFIKPNKKLSLKDVMNCMRDHFEGTPFDITKGVGSGIYEAPYRPTPLVWEFEGKKYFNERPISTQQTGYTLVAQLRSNLPNEIGGIEWFGCDDPNMIAYTPIYTSLATSPECYSVNTGSGVSFSWKSAFWVCNWVANMVYPRYSQMFKSLQKTRNNLEDNYLAKQSLIETKALEYYKINPNTAKKFLSDYSTNTAQEMLTEWKKLGEYLIVKYNDQAVKPESNGKFELTKDGLAVPPKRPGFTDKAKKEIITESHTKYLVPCK